MDDLQTLAGGYLESAGFRILDNVNGCLVADRIDFGARDTRLVQTTASGQQPSADLLNNMIELRANYPDSRSMVLSPSREGFTRDLLARLSEERIGLVVPVQFFDTPFKVEEAPRTASVIADIRRRASEDVRIPQPFRNDGEDELGDDLLVRLLDELANPYGPKIRFVVGRAGIGKSYLFRALFGRLYRDFLDSKSRQRTHARPIPLLPEHLKGSRNRISHVINNFLHDDIASPISRRTFEWLLTSGFATWMLDGLDELYAGDSEFFDELFDLVADVDSKAQITIWCRDSLLTTSDSFSEFLETCSDLDIVQVFHLSEWRRRHKRQFAWQRLKGRPVRANERDPVEVSDFLESVERNSTLRAISGLPFYCDLLLSEAQEGQLLEVQDDVELLNSAIDQMVAREMDKGLLHAEEFEQDGLSDWMEQIAADYVEGQGYAEVGQAKEYGEVVLAEGLDEERRQDILTSLLQFPFFSPSEGTGRVSFAHDLIAQTLAARSYLKKLASGRLGFFERLSAVDLRDPTLLRFMASRFGGDNEEKLAGQIREGQIGEDGYPVAVSLLLLARPERDLILQKAIQFVGQNLSGVSFLDRDLAEGYFRDCNLTNVTFENCDLTGASFEGAILNRTRFSNCNLHGAQFGGLRRAISIGTGSQELHETTRIRRWVTEQTGLAPDNGDDPCPTALQIVQLFRKFITPLGRSRRDQLDERGLMAGKRIEGAASIDACVRELVRHEYLSPPDHRRRYRRAGGDKHADMVRVVKDGTLSDGVGQTISNLCRRMGCLHQLH